MMNSGNNKRCSVSKIVTVLLMCFCLLFLTGVNLVLYPSDTLITGVAEVEDSTSETDNAPSNPVEEKPVSSGSFAEEFLHEHFYLNVTVINQLMLHKIHEVEKLQIVHFELLSPPPEIIA